METLTSLLPFFLDWLDLIVSWIHIIVGIAWIVTSFSFNWLDSRLDREIDSEDIDGELWSVHSGGFYHINKLKGPPKVFPKELHWFKPFESVLNWSNPPFAKWFEGGKTNVSFNCLDRHVISGNGDKVAIIWEGEPGEVRRITYKELLDEVCINL